MARLIFDDIGERLYETGVEDVVLFPMNSDGSYATGVAWNGVISVEENPSGGEETPLYADDKKYLSLRSKEDYGSTINAYTYPDEWAECDGSAELAKGLRIGQQTRKPFGLCYKTLVGNDTEGTDYGYILHIVYNATASVSSKSHQTVNESPEAVEFSWELKSTAVDPKVVIEGKKLKETSTLEIRSADFVGAAAQLKLDAINALLYGTDPVTPESGDPIPGSDPELPTIKAIYDIVAAENEDPDPNLEPNEYNGY